MARSLALAARLIFALFFGLALSPLAVVGDVPAREGDWNTASATFFDAPDAFKAMIPHEFGHLYSAGCGFTNFKAGVPRSNADLVFPKEMNAALGERNPDFSQGVCGRCLEVRCRTGYLKRDFNSPSGSDYLPVDKTLVYADVAPSWLTTQNRSFPGYPEARRPPFKEKVSNIYAQCWDEAQPIFVRVTDVCPCQRPPEQGGYNAPCCGPQPHMDLSYWAFERLAHPLYGNMVVQYRAVNCSTLQSLVQTGAPTSGGVLGGALSTVLAGEPAAGWGVAADRQNWFNMSTPAFGTDLGLSAASNRNASCATLTSGGSVGWHCLRCEDVFTETVELTVRWAKPLSAAPDTRSDTLPLKVVVARKSDDSLTDEHAEEFCGQAPLLSDAYKAGSGSYGFQNFRISFSAFQCGGTNVTQANANRVVLQNTAGGDVTFCVSDLSV